MKISDLIIDPRSLGDTLWLVDVFPSYQYTKAEEKTEKIVAYKYVVALPEKALEKISVKIDGKQLLEKPDSFSEVSFTNLEIFIYWQAGQPQIGARAKGISLIAKKA